MNNQKLNIAKFFKRLLFLMPLFLLLTTACFNYLCLFNKRSLTFSYINAIPYSQDIIILGTSRSQQISLSPLLKKYSSFFNNSLQGASLENLITFYEIYKKNSFKLPKMLILECSPWFLRTVQEDVILTTFDFIKKIFAPDTIQATAQKIFSSNKTNFFALASPATSIKELFQLYKITKQKSLANKESPFKYKEPQSVDISEVKKLIQQTKTLPGIHNYATLEQEKMTKFESFIKKVLSDDVTLILFFPPYHPLAYKNTLDDKKYKRVFSAQNFFTKIAKKYSLKTVGSYNPSFCKCKEEYFYDCHHMYASSTTTIFQPLKTLL
jgi:hypothetical protein